AAGFSDTKERILQYDKNQIIRYSLYHGLPGFVTSAENTWTLYEVNSSITQIVGQTEIHVKGIMGFLFRGMMRSNLNRVLAEMAEEVKHYIEHGTPHRQKMKAIVYQPKSRMTASFVRRSFNKAMNRDFKNAERILNSQ
ncbi:MAG: hypothetical protein QNJ53_16605, partial [Pleurocapsa sp. MO_192.B19]|nr:hypothetical protein [Pleurocapsa sp. MO_192.B19]